jgi:nucleoside 2-deoxyribosyltransferase
MAYRLIQAGNNLSLAKDKVVFLGGSSRGNDWRETIYRSFNQDSDITFVSPFRTSYPNPEMNPKEHAEIVEWERQAIASCDIAIFWLGAGLSNQASRVEIGYALGTGKTVIVGAEDSFLGLEHLSAFGGFVLSDSLDSVMTRLKAELLSLQK